MSETPAAPAPAAALAKRDLPPAPIIPDRPPVALLMSSTHLAQIREIAALAMMAGTDMLPANIKSKEQAAAIIMAGAEAGLRPWTALRHVYTVNGKTEIETRAMVGIVRARDPRITFEWPEYTDKAVTCTLRRTGQPPVTVRYTIADANASGQTRKKKRWVGGQGGEPRRQIEVNGPWQLYTRDMLYAAATKRACRLGAPDLINAIEGVAAPYDVVDAEYTVTTVADAPPAAVEPPPVYPGDDTHNAGDAPGTPLPPEVEDAEWEHIGAEADREAPPPGDDDAPARRSSFDPETPKENPAWRLAHPEQAPPAAADPTCDPADAKQAGAMFAQIGKDYAAQNVAQLRTRLLIDGKVTGAGNLAFSRYTVSELAAAVEAMRDFCAGGAPQQSALGE